MSKAGSPAQVKRWQLPGTKGCHAVCQSTLECCRCACIAVTLLSSVQAVQGYLLLSGLVGAAVTYYYDDDRNVKFQKLLRAGLMLIGLGLVFWSTSMTEASLVLCGLLMLSVPLNMLLQRR